MGGVFLRRPFAPKAEIINDLNGEVANLFRILQRHYPQFMEFIRFQITSRREFERLKASDPDTLTDLERAARFLYMQRVAYGGNVGNPNFGIRGDKIGQFNINKLGPILEAIHERVAGVTIENLTWQDLISRYDAPETLFYLDPPYWGSESDYGKDAFDRAQFAEMANVLASITGKFLLSINDVPETRATFAAFQFEEVELNYSMATKTGKAAKELIFSNVEASVDDLFG